MTYIFKKLYILSTYNIYNIPQKSEILYSFYSHLSLCIILDIVIEQSMWNVMWILRIVLTIIWIMIKLFKKKRKELTKYIILYIVILMTSLDLSLLQYLEGWNVVFTAELIIFILFSVNRINVLRTWIILFLLFRCFFL